jgi:hypothetical protein
MDLARYCSPVFAPPDGPAPFATPPGAVVVQPAKLAEAAAPLAPLALPEIAPAVEAAPVVEAPAAAAVEAPIVAPVVAAVEVLTPAQIAAQEIAVGISAAKSKAELKASLAAPAAAAVKEIPAPAAPGEALVAAAPVEAAKVEAQPPAPVVYGAFKLPDGVKFEDAKLKDKFLDLIAPHGVPQATAQKLIDNLVEEIQRVIGEVRLDQRKHWNGVVAANLEACRKDPRIANRFDTAMANGKAFVETYALNRADSDDILRWLGSTGLGVLPSLVKMFDRVGEMLNVLEDGIVAPTGPDPTKVKKNGRGWYDDGPSPQPQK